MSNKGYIFNFIKNILGRRLGGVSFFTPNRELSVSRYYHLLLLLLFLLCYLSVCSVSTRPILGAMKIVSRIFHKNLIFAKASISYFQHLLATKKRKMSRNLLRIYVATLMCTVYIQYLTSPSQALMILIHPSSSGPTGRLLEVVVLHILRDGVYYAKMPSLAPIRRLRQNRTPVPCELPSTCALCTAYM